MEKTEIITGRLPKIFVHYVSLNVLSMIGMSCYILADTVFVAGGVGNSGLAALNLVLPAYSFINGAGLMLGMGGATRYAVLRGEGRDAAADRVFTQALALGAAIGCVLTLTGFFFTPALARLLGAEGAILQLSVRYLRTILLFSCAFMINNILVCFIRNDGSPSSPWQLC
ncbi:MATE family efflux transporter [Eubacterium maltosivorans]|uniref:MATE family efflux transporter n=1 Tax=Eubacterium maltosivorans TaxID=2041044 RepID=UPI003A8FAE0C